MRIYYGIVSRTMKINYIIEEIDEFFDKVKSLLEE